jgi:hypothetical protein
MDNISTLPFVLISLTITFTDAFLDAGQLLLQLILIVLQRLPLLFGRKETTKSRTASTTTTGASCQLAGYW